MSYTVNGVEFELKHYGVKGMKWGRRKARPVAVNAGRRGGQTANDSPKAQAARKEARRQKAKRAAKIGAAVVGTALAAYGTYKLAKHLQDKRSQAAMKKAQNYIDNNIFRKVGDSAFQDGSRRMDFVSAAGNEMRFQGSRSAVGKAVGQHNAKVVAAGRQMYRDATNTRLDRGLARVVGAGDAVGSAAKRAGTNAANAANKAKNAFLDVVNPQYEYVPGATTTSTRNYGNGITMNKAVTNYYKRKKRR